MMKILIGYDGSVSADAAIDDLRRAGLPRDAQVLIVSVGEVMMPPSSIGSEPVGPPATSRRVMAALEQAEARAAQVLKEAEEFAAKAGDRVRSYFPDWQVQAEGVAGWPATELIDKADEWKADLVVVGSQGRFGSWAVYPRKRVEENSHRLTSLSAGSARSSRERRHRPAKSNDRRRRIA